MIVDGQGFVKMVEPQLPLLEVTLPTAWGVVTYPPGASFGPRRMRDYEFVWIMEGSAEYRWEEQTVLAPPGSIVLCRPGTSDFFQWDRHTRTRHAYFHFSITTTLPDWPMLEDWPLVRIMPSEDILRPLFRHLLTWAGRGDPGQMQLTVAHLLTAYLTGQIGAGDVPPSTWPEPVERAWQYLHHHLEEQPDVSLTLTELADAACVTPEHLCRLFQTATGHSPMETVRRARLDRAATLLARTNYSVGEIADLCGFASPFHFARRFKEAFGHTPRALRQSVQNGSLPPTPLLIRHSLT